MAAGLTGSLAGFGAILLWSATVALTRSLAEQVGPVTGASAVYAFSGAVALLGLLGSPARRREAFSLPLHYLFVCGALFVCYVAALAIGVGRAANREDALAVGLLNYLWPALTVVFSLWLLERRADGRLVPGVTLAIAGAWLSLTHDTPLSLGAIGAQLRVTPLPYVCGLAAALSWALYSNLTRRWAGDAARGGAALFLPVAGLIFLLLRGGVEEPGAWTWRAATEVVALGTMTLAAYLLWDLAMRRGDFPLVAAAAYFTPLLSTVVSCAYLRVRPGWKLWIGCAAIVAGSLLSWRATVVQEPKRGNG